jgi:hypothetical protein
MERSARGQHAFSITESRLAVGSWPLVAQDFQPRTANRWSSDCSRLAAAALTATIVGARRACRVDPVLTLRHE